MKIKDISLPEIYKSSADFRFFCDWFEKALTKIQYDTENFFDLYDPLRCPANLLWLLADTIGFKYDDRLPTAFNRLVLVYFMSMIRNKGSKDGVTLAAEVNLSQFTIQQSIEESEDPQVANDRLEDTTIPVKSVFVSPHTKEGYIDVVYYSSRKPIDACIEYVRPVGMYLFQHAGVEGVDVKTKLLIDARLTDMNNLGMSIGPTHVGHYSRADYASLQKGQTRNPVYYRNSDYEGAPNPALNPGYRSLCSLQLCNNDHIVRALMGPIFGIGYHPGPDDVEVVYSSNFLNTSDPPEWNLRYDLQADKRISGQESTVFVEEEAVDGSVQPNPAVNPIMCELGDSMNDTDEPSDSVNE